jgi:ATP-dependent DNA helicase RecG
VTRFHYQDGLFMRDIPVFNETVVREAILKAVTHRDYRLPGSVFVKEYRRKLDIISRKFSADFGASRLV